MYIPTFLRLEICLVLYLPIALLSSSEAYLYFPCCSTKRKRKKKIRRILDDTELGEETKRKIAIEKVKSYYWRLLYLFIL